MNVIYRPEALSDYEQIYETAYRNWPGRADAIVERLEKQIELLARFPLLSELVRPPFAHLPGLRFSPVRRVGKFVIYYQPFEAEIRIIRILSGWMDHRAALDDA